MSSNTAPSFSSNSDGKVTTSFGSTSAGQSVTLQADGKILVGGAFTNFNGVPQNRFTRLHGGQNAGSGLVVFSAPVFAVSEAGTNATITVLRTGGTSNSVSVDYSVIPGGTAIPGVDYVPVGGTLTFPEGETLRSFVVPVIDDTLVRPDRTVQLTLSNAVGGAALDIPPTALLRIVENDSLLTFSASSFSVAEGVTNALVTVTRTGGTNESVTVDYFTTALTATPLADYTNVAGTLAFAPGTQTQTFTVPIVNDLLVEASETVALFLTNAGPAGIASMGAISNATLTIVDDDFGVGVLGFASTNFSALENVGLAGVTVVRTNGSSGAVSINYTTVDVGTATPGFDYLGTNGILVFADGETSKTFYVALINDAIIEGNETLGLALSNTTGGAGLGLTNATLTIVDDDAFGVFQFTTNSYSMIESSGSVTVSVDRVGGVVGSVAVGIYSTSGTATPGLDYVQVSQVLTFASGQTNVTVTVPIINDQAVEPVETIGLILRDPTGGALLGALTNTTISIVDDDMQFSFAATNFSVLENAGTAIVNVVRYGVTNLPGSVNYATSDGTAFNGIDYTGVTNTAVFPPGVVSTNFFVAIIDNQIVQPNRALNLGLFNASSTDTNSVVSTNNASPGTNATATLTIIDDDNTFSFSATEYTVNESAGSLSATVQRFGQNTGNVSVVCSTAPLAIPNTATASQDYIATASTLFFAPGQSNLSFGVSIVADTLPEGNEFFGLTLTNPLPVGAALLGATNTATVTIVDDDIGIGFSTNTYSISESGGAATITVNRAGVTNVAVSVSFTTSNGTAQAGSDYVATNGVLVFAAGVVSRTFTVPVVNDTIAESPETVNLLLSNPTGGAFFTLSNAVLTIVDNVGSVGFTATNFLAGENSTNGVVMVSRTGGSSGPLTVDYFTTSGGTATLGLDYGQTNGTLGWTNGETGVKTFLVPVFNDQLVEATETIQLRLTNATLGAGFGITNATLSIVDNDGPGGVDFGFDTGVGFNNSVYAVAQQTNGQLLAAGLFTSYNGSNRARLARLNLDGTLDTGYNAGLGPDSGVNAIALQPDGRLIIGGDFTSVGGSLRSRIARLLADGSLDTSFSVGSGANSSINALVLQPDGKTIVGGNFTNYNGTTRLRIARLNTSGSLDTSFTNGTGANGFVNALALYVSGANAGKVLVGGSFTSFNGVTSGRIVRLNPDASLDSTFNPGTGANSTVTSISIQTNGQIVIGGLFSSVNGTSRSRLARLNGDGSLDTTFSPVMNDTVLSVVVQPDGKLVTAGAFTVINGDIGTPPSPGVGVSFRERAGNVVTLTTSGGHNLAIGSRVAIGGVGAGFDGTYTVTAIPSSTRFSYTSAGADAAVTAVTPSGTFSAQGTLAGRIARILPDGSIDGTFITGSGADNLIYTVLLQSDLKIVLAGDFSTVNSAVRGRIARLNGNSNTAISTTLVGAGFTAGQFVIAISAEPGRQYEVQYSTTLLSGSWQTLATVNSGHGVVTFTDTASAGTARRYYRVIQLP